MRRPALLAAAGRRAAAGGGSSGPGGVTGVYAWHQADAVTGLSNNAAVTAWADSSANGFHATSVSTAKPSYKTNSVNGKPVLGFGAGGPASSLGSSASASLAAQTVFAVARPLLTGSLSIRGCDTGGLQFRVQGGYLNALKAGVVNLGSGATQTSTSAFSVMAAAFTAGSSWQVYLNGALDGSGTTTVTLTSGLTTIIGGSGTGGSEVFYGDIAELVVFDRVLSSTDRAAVTGYLGTKYGITVS